MFCTSPEDRRARIVCRTVKILHVRLLVGRASAAMPQVRLRQDAKKTGGNLTIAARLPETNSVKLLTQT